MGIGDWGLGIGDWGLGQSPDPIPNPQSPTNKFIYRKFYKKQCIEYDYLFNLAILVPVITGYFFEYSYKYYFESYWHYLKKLDIQ